MDWVDVVSRLGFPVAAFGVCAWFLKYVFDRCVLTFDKCFEMITDVLNKYAALADAVNDNSAAVNHNSEVLRELVTEVKRINE